MHLHSFTEIGGTFLTQKARAVLCSLALAPFVLLLINLKKFVAIKAHSPYHPAHIGCGVSQEPLFCNES